ncbi:MAG: GntR family transcriptional regulator [Pseudomonadota bacterium]
MPTERASQLHDGIEDLILEGGLPPGTRLDEMSLAARFSVSRTPVREALRSLAAAGLIELRPYRGAVVAEIGPARLHEMFETMAELEALCARFAAERAGKAEREAITTAHAACVAEAAREDEDAYYYVNARFHEAICTAAGNGFLADQTMALRRRLKPFRRHQLRATGRVNRSLDEHAALVEAIVARDVPSAMAQMRAHVLVQNTEYGDLVAAGRLQAGEDAGPAGSDAGGPRIRAV